MSHPAGSTRKRCAAARPRGRDGTGRGGRTAVRPPTRGRGMLTYLPAARPGSSCSPRDASHPGTGDAQRLLRRPSPPRGTNSKLPAAAAATPLPSDGSYLRPPWVRLRAARPRAPSRSADAPRRRKMAATLSACHAVFTRAATAGRRAKAGWRPYSAHARWEASRARLRGWAPYGERAAPPVGGGSSTRPSPATHPLWGPIRWLKR